MGLSSRSAQGDRRCPSPSAMSGSLASTRLRKPLRGRARRVLHRRRRTRRSSSARGQQGEGQGGMPGSAHVPELPARSILCAVDALVDGDAAALRRSRERARARAKDVAVLGMLKSAHRPVVLLGCKQRSVARCRGGAAAALKGRACRALVAWRVGSSAQAPRTCAEPPRRAAAGRRGHSRRRCRGRLDYGRRLRRPRSWQSIGRRGPP